MRRIPSGLSVLALADARFPNGGHVHSGGVEQAVASGLVTTVHDLGEFLLGRLHSVGRQEAVFAAASARAATHDGCWAVLDREFDARTPSVAQRNTSRAQGWGLLRAGRATWPSPALTDLATAIRRPHHAVVLGVLVAAAGAGPREAALVAGYLAVSGPSSAAVRLLGLDPFAVNAAVTALADDLDLIADAAETVARADPSTLSAPGSPVLDLLAEAHDRHHREEVRLFAS